MKIFEFFELVELLDKFSFHKFWQCFFKVLKCELLTLGCIAAAPAAVLACEAVCAGTLGLGCATCIAYATGGAVALCDSALTCWKEAFEEACVPPADAAGGE